MKKFFLTFFVFFASAGYVLYQFTSGTTVSAATAQTTPVTAPITQSFTPSAQPSPALDTAPAPKPVTNPPKVTVKSPAPVVTPPPTPAPVVQTPPPVTKPKGQYVDGTYTGSAADAYYGYIQVKAVIQGGKLTDVIFLQYPNDRRTSQHINDQAMPELKQEAIAAQSANVSGVSGASDTTMAFTQSLGDALAQAKNS